MAETDLWNFALFSMIKLSKNILIFCNYYATMIVDLPRRGLNIHQTEETVMKRVSKKVMVYFAMGQLGWSILSGIITASGRSVIV